MKYTVKGNVLEKVSHDQITSNSVNYSIIKFEFDDVWTGLTKTVVFKQGLSNRPYEIVLAGNTCVIPQEVLRAPSELQIGVIGSGYIDGEMVRISTNYVFQKIVEGAVGGEATLIDPTPSVYEQILDIMYRSMTPYNLQFNTLTEATTWVDSHEDSVGKLVTVKTTNNSYTIYIVYADYTLKNLSDVLYDAPTTVMSAATHYEFPTIGDPNKIYIATEEHNGKGYIYRWCEARSCYEIPADTLDELEVNVISGGSAS